MGKAKQRSFARARNSYKKYDMTREQAVDFVVSELIINNNYDNAKEFIMLFGLTADELGEAGLSYEHLRSLGRIIK
ncbi:MAG: hypothetical protein PHX18_01725 [Candidatus Gastranaerophilales bacterium]|nr:hypothetical protein [Candidatus Gastranaerophilales bacterium]